METEGRDLVKRINNDYAPNYTPPEEKLLRAIFGEPMDEEMPFGIPSVADPMGMMGISSQSREKPVTESNFIGWRKEGSKYRKIEYFKADSIPSGVYEITRDDNGPIFKLTDFPTDNLMLLPGMPNEFILEQIDKFWDKEAIFKEMGFLHKRGIILYGPAGCGKTSIIRMLSDKIISRNGIVLNLTNPYHLSEGLEQFRSVEPDRQILLIIEDIDGHMEDSDTASLLLSILDGERQVNKIVYLATTNKPEVLEERIIKRPGRFDVIIGLDSPTTAARKEYLKSLVKDKISDEELTELAERTHGFGIAHLRELIAAWQCLGLDKETTLERLRANIKHTPRIKGDKEMGFSINYFGETGKKPKKDD